MSLVLRVRAINTFYFNSQKVLSSCQALSWNFQKWIIWRWKLFLHFYSIEKHLRFDWIFWYCRCSNTGCHKFAVSVKVQMTLVKAAMQLFITHRRCRSVLLSCSWCCSRTTSGPWGLCSWSTSFSQGSRTWWRSQEWFGSKGWAEPGWTW